MASAQPDVTQSELADANARLEKASYAERLAYAVERWGERLLFTSSFGAGSGVLLHLWSEVAPHLPVVFIDTGFLFDETLAYRDRLAESLHLTIRTLQPSIPRDDFIVEHGADIQGKDPDFCCKINKIDPLAPVLREARGWVSGLRRDQSSTRANVPILLATDEGHVKVHPIATMSAQEAAEYMARHHIEEHPLRARRFLSIGCWPCTRAVAEGEDERSGRWAGRGKTECGLHSAIYVPKTPPAR
ncbi:phosphoadenylyl-sulfate reductase [Pendulispora brunnea]|uniref:Adenosine 5'-phosphosulfate reductase n=1 Tax=Pendulispora brunnea TaxID=2905690 RepID=A0ABZ2KF41_9BACT